MRALLVTDRGGPVACVSAQITREDYVRFEGIAKDRGVTKAKLLRGIIQEFLRGCGGEGAVV